MCITSIYKRAASRSNASATHISITITDNYPLSSPEPCGVPRDSHSCWD